MSKQQVIRAFGMARADVRSRKTCYGSQSYMQRMMLLRVLQVSLSNHDVPVFQSVYEEANAGSWGTMLSDVMPLVYTITGVQNFNQLCALASNG